MQDGLGSVRLQADADLVVDGVQHFAPYGVPFGEQGTFDAPFGFTGEQVDDNDLLFLRARQYAPDMGVFPSLDPIEQGNRYSYTAGNPNNNVDPSGQLFWTWRGGRRRHINRQSAYDRSSDYAHPWIEYWMEDSYGMTGFWNVHAEFPGGANDFKIDLIAFDEVQVRAFSRSPVDFGDYQVKGRVFEIGPADERAIPREYSEVLTKYWIMKSLGSPFHRGVLPNQDGWAWPRSMQGYEGAPYDWHAVDWVLGERLSPQHLRGPVYINPSELAPSITVNAGYWAMLIVDGLILYMEDNELTRRALQVAQITASIAATYMLNKYRQAQNRRDGGHLPDAPPVPEPTPQPTKLELSPEGLLLLLGGICLLTPWPDEILLWLSTLGAAGSALPAAAVP